MDGATFVSILVMGLLSSNILFVQGVGAVSVLGQQKVAKCPYRMGLVVVVVLILSALVCHLLYYGILEKANIQYFAILLYMVVIAGISIALDAIVRKASPKLHKSLGNYLTATIINSLVLYVVSFVVLHSDTNQNLLQALFNALFVGIGFVIALIIMDSIKQKIALADTPKHFRGIPILLLSLGIIAMAFFGFKGLAF